MNGQAAGPDLYSCPKCTATLTATYAPEDAEGKRWHLVPRDTGFEACGPVEPIARGVQFGTLSERDRVLANAVRDALEAAHGDCYTVRAHVTENPDKLHLRITNQNLIRMANREVFGTAREGAVDLTGSEGRLTRLGESLVARMVEDLVLKLTREETEGR